MKSLLATILVFISYFGIAQPDSVQFYTLSELVEANPDTIQAISIRKQKLTALPDELMRFKHIQYLDLGKNKLEDLDSLSQFKNLIYLNIEKNGLIYFPIAVCSMPELKELVLNRNEFSNVPYCIENCQKLERVDMWATALTDFADQMKVLPNLKSMDLRSIKMSPTFQENLIKSFPNTKLYLDSPCDCMQ